ncbi:GHKL domain-containing protein [Paenibacillus sp. JNUCC31]|uniref:sensor histidine kinase n=1 Tax=Paenibacillus sp. JNUCC-31 TaxID=2777983 RepID=UPI00177FA621|nr:GHKL domain-containing protein [Paenibacillus sp. JNUCC-31]QOS77012.1 GHKL domain-containing protein [Paenibacillus sp. JNUCC-31]
MKIEQFQIFQLCSIFGPLMLGLSLIGQNPKKVWREVGFAVVIMAVIVWGFSSVVSYSHFIFIILLLWIPLLKKVLKISYAFTVIAVLLAFVLFMFQIMISQTIPHYTSISSNEYKLYVNLILALLCSVLSFVVHLTKLTIFPQNIEVYAVAEKSQKTNFKYYLVLMMIVLSILIVWIGFLIGNLSMYPLSHQVFFASVTFILFIIFVSFMRRLSIDAMERIEAILDKQYQTELLGFMHIIRSQRHDFNFHLQAIYGMLENKNYSDCSDYVKTMVEDASTMNDVLPLSHPAISALLNTFSEMASLKGIKLEFMIYYNLEQMPCTVYETNKVIGNLIQNAIDEVEQHPDRPSWIKVMILKRSNNNVIKVSNSIQNNMDSYKNMFNPGYSTKESHEGIGLTTVQRIVSKYNGTIYPEFEGDIIHFIVKIPFKY